MVWMIKKCQIFTSNKISQQGKITKSLTSDQQEKNCDEKSKKIEKG